MNHTRNFHIQNESVLNSIVRLELTDHPRVRTKFSLKAVGKKYFR